MDRSMSQALISLIPSLSGPLPPDLLELAVSLLAQSRSKASSLKADEEIARSYACANLACERLKPSLGLPKIEPRPPCPPKVYEKLYRYLDSILPAGTRRTARVSRQNSSSASTLHPLPAKSRTPAKTVPLKPDTRQKKTPLKPSTSRNEVPAWIMPVIRQICHNMGALAAPHHVFAGVSSIQASGKQQSAIKIQALIVAVFILVTTRLAGTETAPDEYRNRRNRALQIVRDTGGNAEADGEINSADIDDCMREVKAQKWTHMDWFENITPGAGLGLDKQVEDDVEDGRDNSGADDGGLLRVTRSISGRDSLDRDYLQAGLGTMMRDQVDYLSDDKRREYQMWKHGILAQLEILEGSPNMDVRAD